MEKAKAVDILRAQIDRVDADIIRLIGNRLEIVKDIGLLKKQHNIPHLDIDRKTQVQANYIKLAAQNQVSEKFAQDFYELLHTESLRVQC